MEMQSIQNKYVRDANPEFIKIHDDHHYKMEATIRPSTWYF